VTATLANGLTLILSERKTVPIVATSLVFRTGSDANPLDKPGLASFVAAMLDEGTATKNALQIADEVAVLGGSLGTSSSMDASTVTARALAKNFPALLNVVADVVLNPSFPAAEIERQRAQRLAQLVQQREDPASVAAVTLAAALYGPKHPYGYPEIGTEGSVKAITVADMQAFWKQNFVPNNAALIVAGDITMPELRALAEKAFGGWQRGTPAQPQLSAPQTTDAKVVIVNKPGPQTQVRVGTVGAPRSSPDFRPLQLMNVTLGGSFSSRINMNLREKNGYTYGASSAFDMRMSAGPFLAAAGVQTDKTAEALGEFFNEFEGILKTMPAAELEKTRNYVALSFPSEFETSRNLAQKLEELVVYNLPEDTFQNFVSAVEKVTADDVQKAAERYILPDRMAVVIVGDRAAIEPAIAALKLGPIRVVPIEEFFQ
jgi:zinc protease